MPNKSERIEWIKTNLTPLQNKKYCSFCGAYPFKMKNHVEAHKLRIAGELLEAFKYY